MLASDTFVRTTSNGWGTADVGGDWSLGVFGTLSYFSTDGSRARITPAVAGSGRNDMVLDSVTGTDADVIFRAAPQTPVGGLLRVFCQLRSLDGNNGYRGGIEWQPDGSLWARIEKKVAGVNTPLVQVQVATGVPSLTWYRARFRVAGSSLQIKVWADGSTEPASWTGSVTDTDLTDSGPLTIRTYFDTPMTNKPLVFFDSLVVSPPTDTLAVGKIESSLITYGASIAGTGAVTLSVGRLSTAEVVRGVTLAGAGSVTLLAGKVASSSTVRGANVLWKLRAETANTLSLALELDADTIVYRDTFDGVALGSYWDGAYSFGGVEVSGGHLSLTCDPNYSGIDHRTLMDLTADGWCFRAKTVEFPTPSGAAVRDVYMILFDSSTGNQFWIGLAGDTLEARSVVGGGGPHTLFGSAPFVLADMIWWQLRRENGKIHFEHSADGEGWTSIATVDPPYDISTMRLELGVGSDITGFSQDKWVIEEFGQYASGLTLPSAGSTSLTLAPK